MALSLLEREAFSVLVADLRMPGMGGLDLVFAARAKRPTLPVVVMTAYPTSDVLQRIERAGSIEFIEKPFDFSAFVATVERAIGRNNVGFSGAIVVQTLPDVIQLYALSNATGALRVTCGERSGVVWFERGMIPHAESTSAAGTKSVGPEAFYEILSWSGGTFSMHGNEIAPRRSIEVPWMELVMEGCRLADERSSARSTPNPSDTVHTGWTIVPPSSTEIPPVPIAEPPLTILNPLARINNPRITHNEEDNMPNYKESLSKLDSLDGFIGACLCDAESGMVLAMEGGGMLNLEVAGASNAEVVRAKRKAAKNLNLKDDIEDILITLGKQYHLIRPLKAKPNVFFYLALDRSRSNLGMARMTLADVERELVL